jgi:hypothetical protein
LVRHCTSRKKSVAVNLEPSAARYENKPCEQVRE